MLSVVIKYLMRDMSQLLCLSREAVKSVKKCN